MRILTPNLSSGSGGGSTINAQGPLDGPIPAGNGAFPHRVAEYPVRSNGSALRPSQIPGA